MEQGQQAAIQLAILQAQPHGPQVAGRHPKVALGIKTDFPQPTLKVLPYLKQPGDGGAVTLAPSQHLEGSIPRAGESLGLAFTDPGAPLIDKTLGQAASLAALGPGNHLAVLEFDAKAGGHHQAADAHQLHGKAVAEVATELTGLEPQQRLGEANIGGLNNLFAAHQGAAADFHLGGIA